MRILIMLICLVGVSFAQEAQEQTTPAKTSNNAASTWDVKSLKEQGAVVKEVPKENKENEETTPTKGNEEKVAANSEAEAETEEEDVSLSKRRNNVMKNVDINADNIMWDPFIFSGELKMEFADGVKEQIEERRFASDEFFMQNIDREEFEQERALLIFKDREQRYKSYLRRLRAKRDQAK